MNTQNVIWERQSTVSANLFSTVIFGLKDWLQKVESSNYGWETKESWAWTLNLFDNQLVYRGFLNRRADRNIWFSSQMMASLMWSKRTYTTFILAFRIAIVQQNFRCIFHPVANHTSTLCFIFILFFLFSFVLFLLLTWPLTCPVGWRWPRALPTIALAVTYYAIWQGSGRVWAGHMSAPYVGYV